jgi:hypothetical protein
MLAGSPATGTGAGRLSVMRVPPPGRAPRRYLPDWLAIAVLAV